MSDSNTSTSGGIGVFGLLGVVFITLKILAIEPVVHWSWWAVLAPLWGPVLLILVIAIIVLPIIYLIQYLR